MQLQVKLTLFERLAGAFTTATLVDDFIATVTADP